MISIKTMERIAGRQGTFVWGRVYIPGILAVPGEAPSISRASRLNSRKLGRVLHLLSIPERAFTQFALFNPSVFDVHEQQMLHIYKQPHPLHGHPFARGMDLLPVIGTSAVAEQIGMHHAEIRIKEGNKVRYVEYPYLGDLLLFLKDDNGLPYALNWTIKLSALDFGERKRKKVKTLAQQRADKEAAVLRNALEEEYYLSAGIRTVKLSLDDIDRTVVANLDLVYGSHGIDIGLEEHLLTDYSADIKRAAEIGDPLAPIAIKYGKKWGRRDLFLTKIYQDIWDRKLMVDFFQNILIDQPLNIGGTDILECYRSFFEGASK